jgi:glutamate-1-semialdehyde 2,1-aminomutase
MKTEHSQRLFNEAKTVMVGGVNSPVRSFNSVGGHPLVIKYGRGSQIFDYDGNAFTDYCLSWGALILGHANPNTKLAAKKMLEGGSSFGTTTREEIELAKVIVKHIPSIDLIRFVNSGTEATMSAIRLARGFTKKDILVKFDGCYHGHFDDLLTKAGSGVAQLKESSSLGIPASHIQNTISLPFNDILQLEKTLTKHKDNIACVIIEPVAGNMGVVPASKEFLQTLRELTKKFNIVLIFDEVMTGFRFSLGGAQETYGIIPDMTCLGKIIGGGFPIGAYGGRREIMECLAPLGGVYQAGTFSGNPVVMKTGLAVLRQIDKNFFKRLNKRSTDFVDRTNQFFQEKKIAAHLVSYNSMISIRFRTDAVYNYEDAKSAAGGATYAKLFNHLLQKGIYFPPADLEAFFVSSMHTQKDLDQLFHSITEFFNKETA